MAKHNKSMTPKRHTDSGWIPESREARVSRRWKGTSNYRAQLVAELSLVVKKVEPQKVDTSPEALRNRQELPHGPIFVKGKLCN